MVTAYRFGTRRGRIEGPRRDAAVVEFRTMDESSKDDRSGGTDTPLFTPKAPMKDEMPVNAWAIAGLVVLVIVGVLLVMGRHKPSASPNTVLPLDAYAAKLPLSQLAMSESTSLSGGKSTFIDGHIGNTGSSTVTGVTVQVLFHNDEAMPPFLVTLPLALIRTHEPYVDTQPVSAAPLKPGDDREFRLIFETVPTNWNTQMPEIHVVQVATK
jgi:hypothetical protein